MAYFSNRYCCDLLSVMSSRISGWFVLSAVFIVAVFGLFFTFTERKTWPEHKIELSATDQRLIPPASTVWCEAIALSSDHPFVAYQVSQSPLINPNHLNKQKVSVNLKLGSGRSRNSFKLKYFLLTSSVLEMFACASQPGARLLVFKGEDGVQEYLQKLNKELRDSDSDESEDSFEESSEEIRESKLDCSVAKNEIFTACKNRKKQTLFVVSDTVVDTGNSDDLTCNAAAQKPVKVNITDDGYYVIVALNTNSKMTNHFSLQLLIDRSRYSVIKSGQSFDMCSLSTTCTIGLSFASDEGALVWIPDEPNAGRTSFTIRSRCKPRLAVFAILSVFLPLMFFILVAFFVRADRERIRRIYSRHQINPSGNRQLNRRIATPLLNDGIPAIDEPPPAFPVGEEEAVNGANISDTELPPPYHTLYDPPPPYACVKLDEEEK